MTTSFLRDAFAHHSWANDRVIDACSNLTREQLLTAAPGTYGPIIATLGHLISSDRWYLSFFPSGKDLPALDEDADWSPEAMRVANDANAAAWTVLLSSDPDPEEDVVERGDGWAFHVPLQFRLAQVIHHGTDHRSQVCTGLTTLGITPPEIDVWAYGEATGRTRQEGAPAS